MLPLFLLEKHFKNKSNPEKNSSLGFTNKFYLHLPYNKCIFVYNLLCFKPFELLQVKKT